MARLLLSVRLLLPVKFLPTERLLLLARLLILVTFFLLVRNKPQEAFMTLPLSRRGAVLLGYTILINTHHLRAGDFLVSVLPDKLHQSAPTILL